jgi:quinol monooxygenase YgiN
MSDTPETDQNAVPHIGFYSCATVTAEFARKLERERDEAREAFKEMWRSGDAFLPHVDSETINRWRKAAGWEETK